MLPLCFYSPETVERMATVYNRIFKELKIERSPIIERERLANCILYIGNTYTDPRSLYEQALYLYLGRPIARSGRSDSVTTKGAVFGNELGQATAGTRRRSLLFVVLKPSE
jgi:hypothetical protein